MRKQKTVIAFILCTVFMLSGFPPCSIIRAANNIAMLRSVYTDGENIKAVSFDLSEKVTSGVSVIINGYERVSAEDVCTSSSVYEYFDTEIPHSDIVHVAFKINGIMTETVACVPVDIVTTDAQWTTSPSGHTLIAYKGTSTDVVVPNFYNGVIVTSVGANTSGNYYVNIFNDIADFKLTSLKISDGIEDIYPCAFYNVKGSFTFDAPDTLRTIYQGAFAESDLSGDVTIPAGVETVGNSAFWNCANTTGALVLEDGVKHIDTMAFAADGSKKEGFTSLTLPASLKSIGCYAFQYCTNITSLTLPEGLEVISDGAFDHMTGLTNTSLAIPSTVTTIGGDFDPETYGILPENTGYGAHVFYDMGKNESFAEFTVNEGSNHFKAVDGVLYSLDGTRLVGYPRGKADSEFTVPDGVTQIDELAFSRAAALHTLNLPDSYIVSEKVGKNVLNPNGNNLAVAIYTFTGITAVNVSDTHPTLKSADGILYSKDMKDLWYIPSEYNGEVQVADGCERLMSGSVYTNNTATETAGLKLIIPPTVWYVNENANEFIKEFCKGHITLTDSIYYTLENGTLKELAYTLGDADANGSVEKADAADVLRHISGISDDIANKKAADANKDGTIDLLDTAAIINMLA